jgi:hypothetical protein
MQHPFNTLKKPLVDLKKLDIETVEQFIARGGKVQKINSKPPAKPIPFNFMFSWRKRRK